MADTNTLHVDIQADVAGLTKGLNKAENSLKSFSTKTDKMTTKTNKMAKSVKSNAVPAMTSFSQVIQDAPFGIQGVANNITQLTMQFGQLSTKTGGARAALSGMLKTLAGPAGILLAVSVVTSLMVSFGSKLNFTANKAEKLKKKQEELVKSLEKFVGELKAVDAAQLKGAKSSARELTNLKLLKSQLDNNNLSNMERLKAFDELKKKYPAYLSDVTKEDALVGGLDDKYNELSTAILKTAKAQAAARLISQNFQKILTLELKLKGESEKLGKKAIANNNANNTLKKSGALIDSATAEAAIRTQQRYEKQLKVVKATAKSIITLHGNITALSKEVEEQGGIIPLLTAGTKGSAGGGIRKLIDNEIQGLTIGFSELEQATALQAEKINKKIRDQLEAEKRLEIKYGAILDIVPENMKINFGEMEAALVQFNRNASAIIQDGIVNTFAGIGQAIGEGLASGGNILESAGGALLGALGGILTELGGMAITIGVGLLAVQLALNSLNPYLAIAGGIALIALGSFFSSKSKSIGSGIGSGGGSSAGSGGSDFSGRSSFSGGSSRVSSGGQSGGTFVFEIAGTKLIGVLKNTLDRNKALGGSDNLLFG
jgi:hypothetical protein